jgi:hypothetical protein
MTANHHLDSVPYWVTTYHYQVTPMIYYLKPDIQLSFTPPGIYLLTPR